MNENSIDIAAIKARSEQAAAIVADRTRATLLLLSEAIDLGRQDGMAGQHLGAMCSARDEIENLYAQLLQLKKPVPDDSGDDIARLRNTLELIAAMTNPADISDTESEFNCGNEPEFRLGEIYNIATGAIK